MRAVSGAFPRVRAWEAIPWNEDLSDDLRLTVVDERLYSPGSRRRGVSPAALSCRFRCFLVCLAGSKPAESLAARHK